MSYSPSRRDFVKYIALAGASAALAGCFGKSTESVTPTSPTPVSPTNRSVLQQQNPDFDGYGGWKEKQGSSANYFHVEEIDGKQWYVTPDGNVFWSKGVNHVRYDEHDDVTGVSQWHQNNITRYGSEEKWALTAIKALNTWGFNTVGAWSSLSLLSDTLLKDSGVSYTKMLYFNEDGSSSNLWFEHGFPDVWDPEFKESLDPIAEKWCAPRSFDKHLIGYFLGNEPHILPDWRPKPLLDTVRSFPEGSPGREFADSFAKQKGTDEVAQKEFIGIAVGKMCELYANSVKKYDKNHLILSPRFAGHIPETAVKAMKPHVDVICLNSYGSKAPNGHIKELGTWFDGPVTLTEFGYRATDSGLPNTKPNLPDITVSTQAQRAQKFQQYYEGLLQEDTCVGGHMFEFADQPAKGRKIGDGENSNFGLLNVKGETYSPVTSMFTGFLPTIEPRRVGAA